MSRHRLESGRPRYGRIAALCASFVITVVAVLGGAGLFPRSVVGDPVSADYQAQVTGPAIPAKRAAAPLVVEPPVTIAPAESGTGRRIVFSQAAQRVWLITARNDVARTYLVSGSLSNNLRKGSYQVFSRSENATGIDDSGTMRWFVRFARGRTAAIGFHDIPVNNGKAVQTSAQLGTPLSHGCIRQSADDAQELWKFAPIGTPVAVI